MRSALFWLSLPFVLPQAINVRRTALRFSEADGPREGVIGDGQTKRLHMIGDSIAAGVGASVFSRALIGQTASSLSEITGHQIHWSTDGEVGANSEMLLHKLLSSPNEDAIDYLIVSIGVNDVTSLKTVAKWRSNLSSVLNRLNDVYSEPHIAFAGLPPLGDFPLLPQPLRTVIGSRGIEFDRVARDVVSSHSNAAHVPISFSATPERFAADGFHPSEIGYADFGRFIGAALAEFDRRNTN